MKYLSFPNDETKHLRPNLKLNATLISDGNLQSFFQNKSGPLPSFVLIAKGSPLNVHHFSNSHISMEVWERQRVLQSDVLVGDISKEVERVGPYNVRSADVHLTSWPVYGSTAVSKESSIGVGN